jgi:hypothetical protein
MVLYLSAKKSIASLKACYAKKCDPLKSITNHDREKRIITKRKFYSDDEYISSQKNKNSKKKSKENSKKNSKKKVKKNTQPPDINTNDNYLEYVSSNFLSNLNGNTHNTQKSINYNSKNKKNICNNCPNNQHDDYEVHDSFNNDYEVHNSFNNEMNKNEFVSVTNCASSSPLFIDNNTTLHATERIVAIGAIIDITDTTDKTDATNKTDTNDKTDTRIIRARGYLRTMIPELTSIISVKDNTHPNELLRKTTDVSYETDTMDEIETRNICSFGYLRNMIPELTQIVSPKNDVCPNELLKNERIVLNNNDMVSKLSNMIKHEKKMYRKNFAIPRYLKKKKNRSWNICLMHPSRSICAINRTRNGGQFASNNAKFVTCN